MVDIIHSLSQKSLSSYYLGRSVLVTGSNGFAGGYLIPRLAGLGSMVHGIDIREYPRFQGYTYHHCDLLEQDRLVQCIEQIRPDYVFHLASQSSVGSSWQHEWHTIEVNIKTTYNLLNILNNISHPVKLLLVSSGEVYGNLGVRKAVESDNLRPMNPYSSSKAMMEMVTHKFQNTNINYVIARAYNHTGPGRPDTFFEASVAKQFANAKNTKTKSIILKVGNIDNIRDYSDVRDVVDKYLLIACQGNVGQAYNVCSGVGIALREIISMIEEISNIRADVQVETTRLRKNDISFLVGDSSIQFENRSFYETIRSLYESFLKV
jgi:GDP-4-dehydro-6-deoxy-D-mannose reductase